MLHFCIMKAHKTSRTGMPAKAALEFQKNQTQHILVVEDEPDIRRLDTEVLRESGFQVDIAEDGLAALHSLDTDRYDLLIIEEEMSMVTGLELVKKLRAEDLMVPVILVLGTLPTNVSNLGSWPQVQAILFKPYTIAELSRTVREVLRMVGSSSYMRLAPPTNWQNLISAAGLTALKV